MRVGTSSSACRARSSLTQTRPAPVRFLPVWDATLLAHARRTQILPEEYRSRVFGTDPQSVQTFLIDGRVAGTWTYERGRVVVAPFKRLGRDVKREWTRRQSGWPPLHQPLASLVAR